MLLGEFPGRVGGTRCRPPRCLRMTYGGVVVGAEMQGQSGGVGRRQARYIWVADKTEGLESHRTELRVVPAGGHARLGEKAPFAKQPGTV